MVLLFLSKNGLAMLMNIVICYNYSCKLRFEYVPVKCSLLVLIKLNFHMKGKGDLDEDVIFKHVGVNCNNFSIGTNAKNQQTSFEPFFSSVNCGLIHSDILHSS